MTSHHDNLVKRQFGATAQDYVTSAVHASGADLARIAELAMAAAPARALDLGCGGGHVSYALAPHCSQVVACDLSPEMLGAVNGEAARRGLTNITTRAAAAEHLPFAEDEFDFLACRFSAHHWRDIAAGLAEARRVLRPGATAVFADVIAPQSAAADTHLQAIELLRDPSHVRDYTKSEWLRMLADAGFTVAAVTPGRLPMAFASWVARMRTPTLNIAAIRAVQAAASAEVADHFAIQADGAFLVDTLLIEMR